MADRRSTEHDSYGDSVRVSEVESCSAISRAERSDVACAQPVRLFACQGALSDVR